MAKGEFGRVGHKPGPDPRNMRRQREPEKTLAERIAVAEATQKEVAAVQAELDAAYLKNRRR